MRVHLDQDPRRDIVGFAMGNVEKGARGEFLCRASLTSDSDAFHQYVEQMCRLFMPRAPMDAIVRFLVLIHEDASTDAYINDDLPTALGVRSKRDIGVGEEVTLGDIADITETMFPNIDIRPTDKVIHCAKVGWKFGLFFDLRPGGTALDVAEVSRALGTLHRQLAFEHVYKSLASGPRFSEMVEDGWFPFAEILAEEYRELDAAYSDRFDFENRLARVIDRFTAERLQRLTTRWSTKRRFADKARILEAGVRAFLNRDEDGYIHCVKTLLTEVDGLLRLGYAIDTGDAGRVSTAALIDHLVEKERTRSRTDASLLLPAHFLAYLRDVIFSGFDIASEDIPLSRHSAGHGVAAPEAYTAARALQSILTVDQVWFYS